MAKKNLFNLPPQSIQKIGILDSGRGGLTILKSLIKSFPAEYYYLADIKNLPYGAKSPDELLNLTIANINFLRTFGIQVVIIACHTLSATILEKLKKYFSDLIFIDVLQPVVEAALKATKGKRIGIMATSATIKSHAHKNALSSKDSMIVLIEQACPTLASMIEQLPVDHPDIALDIQNYLKPFHKAKVDTLILGCTHYGFIKKLIQQQLSSTIISAEDIMVSFIKKEYNFNLKMPNSTIYAFQTKQNIQFTNSLNQFSHNFHNKLNFFIKTLDSI